MPTLLPKRKATRARAAARAPGRSGVVRDPGMHARSWHGNREISRPTTGPRAVWSASGRRGAVADDVRTGEVRPRHSSGEADEQRRATVRGVGGAKGGGRGERGPGPHAPGSGPGKRVKGTGPRTARCTTEKEGTVHRAPPPCHPRPAPDGLLRPQATSCPRRGWADVAGLRSGPRSPDRELARAGPPGSVPGAARPPRVHPQGGRQPAPAGHRGAGGQDRPTAHGSGAERDLRGGLPRVLVWLPP